MWLDADKPNHKWAQVNESIIVISDKKLSSILIIFSLKSMSIFLTLLHWSEHVNFSDKMPDAMRMSVQLKTWTSSHVVSGAICIPTTRHSAIVSRETSQALSTWSWIIFLMEDCNIFYVLGRVMSGKLHSGQEICILGESYSLIDEKTRTDSWISASRHRTLHSRLPPPTRLILRQIWGLIFE